MQKLPFCYRAKVTAQGQDAGTVYIRIAGMHDEIPDNALPIAYPAFDLAGNNGTNFLASVPPNGSYVYVFFDGGNWNSPVYFATAPASFSATAAAQNNPKIVIDSTKASQFCIEFGGASICISSDGTILINTNGSVLVKGQSILLN